MTNHFEALEPRALLSAPIATTHSFRWNATTLTTVVRYTADTGIDLASIGNDDFRLQGPNGDVRFAQSPTKELQQDGSVLATYTFTNPTIWTNGRYNLGVVAGSVRSTDQQPVAALQTGSYGLWFPDTVVEMSTVTITSDGWRFGLRRLDRNPVTPNVPGEVRITGPGGSETIFPFTLRVLPITVSSAKADGPWSFADNGTYIISMPTYTNGVRTGWQPVAGAGLWFNAPKVEITDIALTDSTVTTTVRLTDNHAIDLTSIRWSNIGILIDGVNLPPTINLIANAEPQSDGSVIVTYVRGWYNAAFTSRDSGTWVWSIGISPVKDVDGNAARAGTLATRSFHFERPFIMDAVVQPATPSTPARLSLTFATENLDLSSLGNDDFRLELGGITYTLSLISHHSVSGVTPARTPAVTAFYEIIIPVGQTLQHGAAALYLNANGLTFNTHPSADVLLRSITI